MVKTPPNINSNNIYEIQLDRKLPPSIIPLDVTYNLKNKHPSELLIPLLNISNKEVKIPKNTILSSFNQINNVDTIQEVSWKKIQDAKNEAVSNTAQDPQIHKLLPTFPEHSNFQIHANGKSKPAVMLQETTTKNVYRLQESDMTL